MIANRIIFRQIENKFKRNKWKRPVIAFKFTGKKMAEGNRGKIRGAFEINVIIEEKSVVEAVGIRNENDDQEGKKRQQSLLHKRLALIDEFEDGLQS